MRAGTLRRGRGAGTASAGHDHGAPSAGCVPAAASKLCAQEAAPRLPVALRRRRQTNVIEDVADGGRRDSDAELAQLADDPQIAPARVLACETHDQLTHFTADRRTAAL